MLTIFPKIFALAPLYTLPLPWVFKHLHFSVNTRISFLFTKTRNEPKRPATNQNEPKQSEMAWSQPKQSKTTLRNDQKWHKNSKLRRCGIFYLFSFFKFLVQMLRFQSFGPEYQLSNLSNFVCLLFWKCWFQIWCLILKISSPNS